MTEPENISQLASEYVLGTLPAQKRREVEQRLEHEPQLRAAVRAWEEKLLPLVDLAEPVTPSTQLWARIENGIAAKRPMDQERSGFSAVWQSLSFWRSMAAGAFAGLIALSVFTGEGLSRQPANFMVVLGAPQEKGPAWVAQVGTDGNLRLIPLSTAEIPPQKSLQFWTKGEGWSAPVSLGLVQPGQALTLPLNKLPPLQPNQLFEITLEPYNGSPIGRPTGPILYLGHAIRVV